MSVFTADNLTARHISLLKKQVVEEKDRRKLNIASIQAEAGLNSWRQGEALRGFIGSKSYAIEETEEELQFFNLLLRLVLNL